MGVKMAMGVERQCPALDLRRYRVELPLRKFAPLNGVLLAMMDRARFDLTLRLLHSTTRNPSADIQDNSMLIASSITSTTSTTSITRNGGWRVGLRAPPAVSRGSLLRSAPRPAP